MYTNLMSKAHSASPIRTLSQAESVALLSAATTGRVAVTIDALPAIFPVCYSMLSGQIVFQVDDNPQLITALSDTVVAFEVDTWDSPAAQPWSVHLLGYARVERQPPSPSDQPAPDSYIVRVTPERVTGQRLPAAKLPAPGPPADATHSTADSLHRAMDMQGLVGQAQGILMERRQIPAGQALAVLLQAAQRSDVELGEVAQDLIYANREP
jgi:hypothetical protein